MLRKMPVTLMVNGEPVELEQRPETLEAFLLDRGFRADRIAVERNGAIVSRGDWSRTAVEDHDRLEIVHFVGGGTAVRR